MYSRQQCTALPQKRYTLGLLSATNPKAKAHKAQALHRVQQKTHIGIQKSLLQRGWRPPGVRRRAAAVPRGPQRAALGASGAEYDPDQVRVQDLDPVLVETG